MTEATLEVERVRTEAQEKLSRHEILCERRYGEIQTQLGKIEAHSERNLKLLYVLLGGMLAVTARSFWPALFGG